MGAGKASTELAAAPPQGSLPLSPVVRLLRSDAQWPSPFLGGGLGMQVAGDRFLRLAGARALVQSCCMLQGTATRPSGVRFDRPVVGLLPGFLADSRVFVWV